MNIIKIDNVKRIETTASGLIIKSNQINDDKVTVVAILSESDINNDNTYIKLIGHSIACLVLPKKYKHTFFETKMGELVRMNLIENYDITYY